MPQPVKTCRAANPLNNYVQVGRLGDSWQSAMGHLRLDGSMMVRMPSWNIHTAHAERLLSECGAEKLGIEDVNAFLFGNYVPDIYLGFLVPDTTYRLDYCLTHLAEPETIPLPDASKFWTECVKHRTRRPQTASGLSLTLGVWAHLCADRVYNERFQSFCKTHDVPQGEELRVRKQADYELFGRSLGTSSRVTVTPALLEAARAFRQYSILPGDVERAIAAADSLLNATADPSRTSDYELLSPEWMTDTFEACHEQLVARLATNDEPARE